MSSHATRFDPNAEAEQVSPPKPNSQIKGEVHALSPGVFPTINLALGRANLVVDFKYDPSKTVYSVKTPIWDPVHPSTREKYRQAGKIRKNGEVNVLMTPDQKAEIMAMDDARFTDGTYRYMISYTHFKRMYGQDGEEYLVRIGYFHGISFMNKSWKWLKHDFDFHYEPVFEQTPSLTGSTFDMNFGDIIRQVKVFHTKWNIDEFERSLKDIPYPHKPNVGVALTVGVEGAPGIYAVDDLAVFKSAKFEDLINYAQSGNAEFVEEYIKADEEAKEKAAEGQKLETNRPKGK